ncbi:DUF4163 domain-containing protein [Novosphingobium sp.]|uniref:DUF4163 domain-containing protein n=1 Tax=Novosphingobium sp. TaxID=1874826 RepID=UPI0025CFBBDE|nr:DUF4163 domain-containing protein [Novosphingobium sp.]
MRSRLIVAALLAAAGCKGHTEPQDAGSAPPAQAAAPAATARASAAASSGQGTARAVADTNDLYEFAYAYPAAAGAIPALKNWLDSDLDAQKAKLIKGARDWQAEAKRGGLPYHAYVHSTKWQVVTDLPGWLSLSAQRWEYLGGAHGNPWSDGLLWDKGAGVTRGALDLFTSPAALSAAIRQDFCAEIDRQRGSKRGVPVKPGSNEEFTECIDPVKSQIILGSGDHQHFTRLGVLVNPYEAGPFAEGNYEVTLPVTAAVLAAIKPAYRGAFAQAR